MSSSCNFTVSPTAEEYFEGLYANNDIATLVITSFSIFITCATIALFGRHLWTINSYISQESRRHCFKWLTFLFPLTAAAAATACCIPRAIPAMQIFISLYLARVMFTLVQLFRDLWGGRSNLIIQLKETNARIKISTSPMCCCCVCLPQLEPTIRNVRIVEWLTMQVGFVRPFVTYMSIVGLSDMGGVSSGKTSFQVIINVLNIISTVIAMWGLQIMTNISREPLKDYCVFATFKIVQLVIVFYNLQGAIFKILASTGVITCSSLLTAGARAEVWHHLALIFEVFFLSVMGTWLLGPRKNAIFDKHPKNRSKNIATDSEQIAAAVPNVPIQDQFVNVITLGETANDSSNNPF